MMKHFVILFAFVLGMFSSRAQSSEPNLSQKIKGTIVDADSKKALQGATIILVSTSSTSMTDKDGNFSFNNVKVGRQTLEISLVGYKPRIINDIMVTSGKEVIINISLTEKSVNSMKLPSGLQKTNQKQTMNLPR